MSQLSRPLFRLAEEQTVMPGALRSAQNRRTGRLEQPERGQGLGVAHGRGPLCERLHRRNGLTRRRSRSGHGAGKCYSVREIGAFLDELGFQEPKYFDTTGNRSIVTAMKPQ